MPRSAGAPRRLLRPSSITDETEHEAAVGMVPFAHYGLAQAGG